MAHYAFLNENNIVVEVISGADEGSTIEGLKPDLWYSNFRGMRCERTSYNTRGGVYYENGEPLSGSTKAFRKNYAGIGFFYDEIRDAFIPPKEYESWVLNEEMCLWESPIPYPSDGFFYIWNEDKKEWIKI